MGDLLSMQSLQKCCLKAIALDAAGFFSFCDGFAPAIASNEEGLRLVNYAIESRQRLF